MAKIQRLKTLIVLIMTTISVSGCMRETNDRLGGMDENTQLVAKQTELMNNQMELLNRELELLAKEIQILNSNTGRMASQLEGYQDFIRVLTEEFQKISKTAQNLDALSQQVLLLIGKSLEEKVPPGKTPDLDDLLGAPQVADDKTGKTKGE
ncbi:MAG: hypothetical protein IT289_10790 [Oligoflexia bacterium]|nr:hypothetical protein [Oligoflexia bacterium]